MDFLREDQCFIFLETGKRYQPYSFLLQSLWNLHVTELFSCHYGVTGRDQIPKKKSSPYKFHKSYNKKGCYLLPVSTKKCKTDPLKNLKQLTFKDIESFGVG